MDVKKGDTLVLLGTKKGLFAAASRDRRRWKVAPIGFEGTSVYRAIADASDGRAILAGAASEHWGPSVQRASSVGGKWKASSVHYAKESGLSVERVWQITRAADGTLYAGVEPAGLFRSSDGGGTWEEVEGFNRQKERADWMPGGGGLCLHTILPHPTDARRMTVAASAVGIFETTDAGATWRLMNGGIRAGHLPDGKTEESQHGSCPHKLVRDAADPETLYMQNHFGVYRRRTGDTTWTAIDKKLPSTFGFPMVAHPTEGGTVYTVPLVADMNRVTIGGAMAVHRTQDGGKSWDRLTKGLPQKNAWLTILRDGMATDGKDPAGLYVGTTTGQLYASRDEGDSWTTISETLPPVLSVSASVVR